MSGGARVERQGRGKRGLACTSRSGNSMGDSSRARTTTDAGLAARMIGWSPDESGAARQAQESWIPASHPQASTGCSQQLDAVALWNSWHDLQA